MTVLHLDMGNKYRRPETIEVINVYSRWQALADGELVDISATAAEAGFVVPVAVTRALWADIETIPGDVSWQDVKGRLWDVIWMARCAVKGVGRVTVISECECIFGVILYTEEGQFVDGDNEPPVYRVKLISGPDDNGEHVITLMQLGED